MFCTLYIVFYRIVYMYNLFHNSLQNTYTLTFGKEMCCWQKIHSFKIINVCFILKKKIQDTIWQNKSEPFLNSAL